MSFKLVNGQDFRVGMLPASSLEPVSLTLSSAQPPRLLPQEQICPLHRPSSLCHESVFDSWQSSVNGAGISQQGPWHCCIWKEILGSSPTSHQFRVEFHALVPFSKGKGSSLILDSPTHAGEGHRSGSNQFPPLPGPHCGRCRPPPALLPQE